jgi:uncharacterized Zn finger protein
MIATASRNIMRYGYDWQPYIPVGEKKAKARRFADKLAKKQKRDRQPIEIQGRKIAKSFWGKAWCDHLESLSDYANRLPRGATYVRNGSVVDLVIQPGKVDAVVAGSEPYEITISINKLKKKTWENIKKDCSSAIDSLIDLLGGRLSDGVMQRLTEKKSGCFPAANQIEMECDCPDWSMCCKHIAAVMYAIGSRLDSQPELLFLLRGVNQEELITQAVSKENLDAELTDGSSSDLESEDLGSIFGIELDSLPTAEAATKPKSKSASKNAVPRRKAGAKKKPAAKKKSKSKQTTKTVATKKNTGVTKKASPKKVNRKKTTIKPAKKAVAKKKAVKSAASAKHARKKKKKTSAGRSV